MILIAPIYLDASILPHFLRHYSELGFREFRFAINTRLNPRIVDEVEEMSAGYPAHIDSVRDFEYVSDSMSEELNVIRKRHFQPSQWISVVDLDEFYELPAPSSGSLSPISDFIQWCDDHGHDHVKGRLVDRIAEDGSLPKLRPSPSLAEQFPLERRLTSQLAGGVETKVVLHKGRHRIRGGHHRIRRGRSLADIELRINHFKWKHGVVERCQERLAVLERLGKPCARESHKLLSHIDQYGCIDVSDRRFFL